MIHQPADWADQEFGITMTDCRPQMSATLAGGARLLCAHPDVSFSQACGNARRGLSRILHDRRLNCHTMLAGHRAATEQRIQNSQQTDFLLPSDTVFFTYAGHQATTGLTPLQGKVNGIVQHNVMVLEAKGGLPLGVLAVHNWARGGHQDTLAKESDKWAMGLDQANDLGQRWPERRFTVVNDRESDMLDFFRKPRRPNVHFIVRVSQPRRYEQVSAEAQARTRQQVTQLVETAAGLPLLGHHEVTVDRANRPVTLTLQLQASAVRVLPPKDKSEALHSVDDVNLVVAREVAARDDRGQDVFQSEQAAEWLLLTSLPIDTLPEVIFVVTSYASRWRIERLHYTMKSGALNSERLQFDEVGTLCNALVLNTIVAWQLLLLCYEARQEPPVDVQQCLTQEQIAVLRIMAKGPLDTIQQASLQIGLLVNFEPSRKQPLPGVRKLASGLRQLNAMCELYRQMRITKTVPT